jgi:hypothetical protein
MGVVLVVAGLVVVLVAIFGSVSLFMSAFQRIRASRGAHPAELSERAREEFATTRHWAIPPLDIAAQHLRETAHLNGYAWVDRERCIVKIPIERAMEVIAREGSHASPTPAPTPAPAKGKRP